MQTRPFHALAVFVLVVVALWILVCGGFSALLVLLGLA